MNLTELRTPFPSSDIEWRIGQAGEKNGKPWAKCLAYITARAIMDRLDAVCGPGDWQVRYREGGGHLQAGIGIRVSDGWVWKWDGTGLLASTAGLSGTDAGKGDFSNAMKRAAVQWGIGRYLYSLPEGWAIVSDKGRFYSAKSPKAAAFHWDPPRLPDWAIPTATSPIIREMEALWIDANRHGVGADNEKDLAGMNAIENAITTGDINNLTKAKHWIVSAIDAAKAVTHE
jgi:hypothetical protein